MMRLGGTLREFPGVVGELQAHGSQLFFRDGDRIRSLSSTGALSLVYERRDLRQFTIVDDTVWIKYGTQFGVVDAFVCVQRSLSEGRDLATSVHPLAEAIFSSDAAAYGVYKDETFQRLRVVDLASDRVRGELAIEYSDLNAHPNGVIGLSSSGRLWCVSWDAQLLWMREFPAKNPTMYSARSPLVHGDLVIAHLGCSHSDESRSLVAAVEASSGSTVWEYSPGAPFGSLEIVGSTVFMMASGRMIALDAETGRVLLDEPSGFAPNGLAHLLHPMSDRLIAVAPRERRVRVFDMDGRTLSQELDVPKAYRCSDYGGAVELGGRYYMSMMSVTLNQVSRGLLELAFEDRADEGTIELAPWPVEVITLRMRVGKDGGEYLHMGIEGGELGDVLRYAEMSLQSSLNSEGAHMWSKASKSRPFNGKIVFSCDAAEASAEAHAQVAAMVARVTEWARLLHIHSGNGKARATVELAPMIEFRRKLSFQEGDGPR